MQRQGYLFVLMLLLLLIAVPVAVSRANTPAQQTLAAWRAAQWLNEKASPVVMATEDDNTLTPQTAIVPGTLVVWQTTGGGTWDLSFTKSDTSTPQPLVRSPETETTPRVRPGAEEVLFTRYTSDSESDLWLVRVADPANPIQLTTAPGIDNFPAWSANGTHIYFSSQRDGNAELYRMRADGSELTRLTTDPAPDVYPTLSHDGKSLAWIRVTDDSHGQVMFTAFDAGEVAPLTPPLSYLSSIAFTHSSKTLIYSADRDANLWIDLGAVNLDGSTNNLFQSGHFHDYVISSVQPHVQTTPANILVTDYQYAEVNGQIVLQDSVVQRYEPLSSFDTMDDVLFINSANADANADYGSLDLAPPHTTLATVPRFIPANGVALIPLTWSVQDQGEAGVHHYLTYKRKVGEEWRSDQYITEFNPPQAYVSLGLAGETWEVAVVGTDAFSNTESITGTNRATVTTYGFRIDNRIVDVRGYPLPEATVTADEFISATQRLPDGEATLYVRSDGLYTFTAPGFQTVAPSHPIISAETQPLEQALPATSSLTADPSLEDFDGPWILSNATREGFLVHSGYWTVHLNDSYDSYARQSFTIPLTATNPTLSLYFVGLDAGGQVSVTIDDGSTTREVLTATNPLQFQHQRAWADLSAWRGEPITLTVRAGLVGGDIRIDDVMVSDWKTPVVTGVTPDVIAFPGAGEILTVTGQNFIAPVTVRFGETQAVVDIVDETTLHITVPTTLSLGQLPLILTNGTGIERTAAFVTVGDQLFLPVLQR